MISSTIGLSAFHGGVTCADSGALRRCRAGVRLAVALLCLCVIVSTGCSTHASRFKVVDHRRSGPPREYREVFDEAYYYVDAYDNAEIVLRRSEPSEADPDQTITQVIHIRSVWRSIPGVTVAHTSQINATVSYFIISGHLGAAFEGAGSVFFDENEHKGTLAGSLDLALLSPTRHLSSAGAIFERAELKGEFRAKRNRRRVDRVVHEMNRLFGPPLPYHPAAPN